MDKGVTMIAMKTAAAYALSALALASFSFQLQAQQMYRIVGADGKVTFSDQPPPASAKAKVTTGTGKAGGGAANNPALPLELRTAAGKFQVTLYTGKDCGPCNAGRSMLTSRGIPFTEKTVESNEDIEALRRLSSESSLPVATIGGQTLKGYSEQDWSQYLDAAGYPASSKLPASYRNPAPTPMVARAPAPAPVAAAAPAPAPAPAAPSAPAPANPAGIKF
jgi:glutaredoxin